MFDLIIIWDLEDDQDGNYVHIVVEHDITQDQVEEVVGDPENATVVSHSSGRPLTFGWTSTGRYLAVVWEHVGDDPRTINPVTAYDARPQGRNRR